MITGKVDAFLADDELYTRRKSLAFAIYAVELLVI